MKKILYTLIAILGFANVSLAQCGTIMVNSTKLQYPDTIANLPNAWQGFPYTAIIQFYAPTSINSVPISKITIGTITGLPSGVNWGVGKYPININSGTSGCIDIQCKSIASPVGTFPVVINATAYTSSGSFPFQILGYKIQVKFTNVFTANQSNWYSQNEWLLNYDSIIGLGSLTESFPYFIMKDSLAKTIRDDFNGGFYTSYNDLISFGSVIDVCDRVIDYDKNPYIKASISDSAYLDSISFPYIYIRNTDSIMVGSFKRAVVDTLIVSWYTKNNLSKYYLNTTPIRVCAQPTINNWDFSNLMQTNFFQRDTILLRKTDTTSLYNNGNGIPESAWTNRTKYLKAPFGMFANALDAQKLFGFTVNFKSGVSLIDTGIMIYQDVPSNLPANLKRPNYFGTLGIRENSSLSLGDLIDSSYSGGLIATKYTSYPNTGGWKGYIPSNAWNYRQFINSSFKVRSKMMMKCGISDSIICKGKTVTFNLSNCNLYNGITNLGTGIINQTPLQTKAYQIKSNGVTIGTITVTVIDSLNIQPITSSDTLSFCGYNSKFLIGVNTANTSPKNYLWYKNDTLLVGKTLAIDTFTTAGKYKVTLNTSTGCYQERSFTINKFNNVFNPDFASNKQIATTTPFDFTFSNNTTPMSDYNFTWSWGDGNTAQNNNLINFYTYTSNGTYSVKLIAQNKVTGCKDSLVKANYITCSGGTTGVLALNTNKINPSCYGELNGSITLNTSGGTTPYQYKLNNGSYQSTNSFTNLSAGIYTVYVKDATNATVSKTDTLTNPNLLTVGGILGNNGVPVSSTQNYNIASQNGVVYTWNIINGTLLSGNGTNNIQVQWAAVAGMGKVIANIAKNACSAADTLVVSIGSNPLTLSTTKTDETCAGKANGAITINAVGGTNPYLYSINNGAFQLGNTFNNLVAGIYVNKVKDASNVISQKTDTINSGPGITAGTMNGPTSVAPSALSTYIIGQQTGLTYLWNVSNGIVASGQGTNMAQVSWGATAGTGMVKVKVTSALGCNDSTMLNVTIGSTNILSASPIVNALKVYPNPASTLLHIDLEKPGYYTAKLSSVSGQSIISPTTGTLDISAIANGVYILSIYDSNNKLISTNKVAIIK